jgi:hypothetical protein
LAFDRGERMQLFRKLAYEADVESGEERNVKATKKNKSYETISCHHPFGFIAFAGTSACPFPLYVLSVMAENSNMLVVCYVGEDVQWKEERSMQLLLLAMLLHRLAIFRSTLQ